MRGMTFNRIFNNHIFLLFSASLFLACLVEIAKHHDGIFFPQLEKLTLIAASNSVSRAATFRCTGDDCIVIAEITDERFQNQYMESTPIDRCQFLSDINIVVERLRPKVLFVDYDLSPTNSVLSEKSAIADPVLLKERTCQSKLDQGLDKLAKQTKLLLINPFRSLKNSRLQDWVLSRALNNITFVKPDVIVSNGMVLTFPKGEHSVARSICMHSNCMRQAEFEMKNPNYTDSEILNFSAMSSHVIPISIERLSSGIDVPVGGVVMLGGRYGKDDRFLTPVGEVYGIDLHSAAYASLNNPVSELSKFVALAVDIVLGMLIGYAAQWLWGHAKNWKLSSSSMFPLLVLMLLALFLFTSVLISLYGATVVLGNLNVWLNPVPIVVGMVIHAFVMTPAEVLGEVEGEQHGMKSIMPSGFGWALLVLVLSVDLYGLLLYSH